MRSAAAGRASVHDLWRTWLLTGVRREAGDRRRIRGAHVGLKRMLIEGMDVSSEKPYTWKDFSDSMIRQSVGDAVHAMPAVDAELVKLAYFGGLSNRDIAQRVQVTEAAVERGLRRALDAISEHVRRGRGFGHKLIAAALAWLGGHWLSEQLPRLAPAGAVAAALILVSQPASPVGDHAAGAPSREPAVARTAVPPAPAPAVAPLSSLPSVAPAAPALPSTPSVELPPLAAPPAVEDLAPVALPPVLAPDLSAPSATRTVTSTAKTVKSAL